MQTVKLDDGTQVYCLRKPEAIVLDSHVDGYLAHGIVINDGDVIFDVGANIGLMGVRAFQRYKGITVFAFEPIPDIFAAMQANANKFGQGRYHAINKGVSAAPGRLNFTYYPNSPALSTSDPDQWDLDPAQLERAVEGNLKNAPKRFSWMRYLPKFIAKYVARHIRSGAVKVDAELTTLSTVFAEYKLEKIDLLKVDCEGAELQVLQGIQPADWPKIQKVVAEVYDVDNRLAIIKEMLTNAGFTKITEEKEKGFEETKLINIFAIR